MCQSIVRPVRTPLTTFYDESGRTDGPVPSHRLAATYANTLPRDHADRVVRRPVRDVIGDGRQATGRSLLIIRIPPRDVQLRTGAGILVVRCRECLLALGFLVLDPGDEQLLVSTGDPRTLLELGLATLGLLAAWRTLGTFEAAHEALDLTGGVNDALLTGIERVALVAQINAQVRTG